jgi:hypothetical protein
MPLSRTSKTTAPSQPLHPAYSTEQQAQNASPWIRRVILASMAGLTGALVYQNSRPLTPTDIRMLANSSKQEDVLAWYRDAPWWRNLYIRMMSGYKAMLEPTKAELLADPYPPHSQWYRPLTLVLELEKLMVYSSWDQETGWKVRIFHISDMKMKKKDQQPSSLLTCLGRQTAVYGPLLDVLESVLRNRHFYFAECLRKISFPKYRHLSWSRLSNMSFNAWNRLLDQVLSWTACIVTPRVMIFAQATMSKT